MRLPASSGGCALVAEDLGVITPGVERLRDELGLPGMLVLQFGFDPASARARITPTTTSRTGSCTPGPTTTTPPAGGTRRSMRGSRSLVDQALAARGIVDRDSWWALIRLAYSSPARVAMIQAQDVLGLGSEARMNNPARPSGNWRWRLGSRALTPALARQLREVTEEAGRLPN